MTRPSIYGVSVYLPDRCRNCNSDVAIVGDAPPPHFTQLRCDSCDCARGFVGHDVYAFLEECVAHWGRQPTRPILLSTRELREPVEPPGGDAVELNPQLNLPLLGEATAMKMTDLFPGKYLRAADIQKPRVVTIAKVSHETFKDNGVDVVKAVLGFKEGGAMVINKTNWNTLAEITGEPDDEAWVGHTIELRSQKVQGPRGMVDSIRVYEAA